MTSYDIYEQLLAEKGLTSYKVGHDTGIATSTLTSWKQGKYQPKPEKLQKIADYLGVRVEYLMGTSEYKTDTELENSINLKKDNSGIKIPVLGNVAAGIPIEMITDIVDWEEIPSALAKTGDFFGLKIKGDSMSPRIAEGDTVIVRKQSDAESGNIVIATINGDSATCKRLMKYKDGISLISFNPVYEPMNFTNAEIESKPVRIIGKVIENRQKY